MKKISGFQIAMLLLAGIFFACAYLKKEMAFGIVGLCYLVLSTQKGFSFFKKPK